MQKGCREPAAASILFQKNLLAVFCFTSFTDEFCTGHFICSAIKIPDHPCIISITATAEITS